MSDTFKATQYRQRAQQCRELASRISLHTDRQRLIEMAGHWTELTRRAETHEAAGRRVTGGSMLCRIY
ncbi:MAG: hypothetical protein JO000_31070 [Alphaproteobacteria bacterium]|nr:hypothetical protein [Alphaproteobacteria bacterium]